MMESKFQINDDQNGQRLDAALCRLLDGCSRNRAVQLIQQRKVLVNNQVKKPGFKVRSGDVLSLELESMDCDQKVLPQPIKLDIRYEDDHIMIIDKSAGMVVHPAAGISTGTLVNALLSHDPGIQEAGEDPARSGIVHRLDKDTSGLMVVAKTDQALAFLQNEFKQRRVKKRYLALVQGVMQEDEGEINLPIGRHPVKRKQMAVNEENGRRAVSRWIVKERFEDASLVEVLLLTGRTHQIRVHFYAIGFPLIGDSVYQFRRNRKKKQKTRQMLHSYQLAFRHPYSGKQMALSSAPPADFARQIKKFGFR